MRLFPATARHRLVVAVTATALGAGVVSVPLTHPMAWADVKHLRHQQAQAHHSVANAQADLDESSKETRHAYAALTQSKADLHAARHDLRVARKHVQAARDQLKKIRRQLDRAQARLAATESELATTQRQAARERAHLVDTVTSFYEQGDPQLAGLVSLLGTSTTAELTDKQNNNSLVLDSQDQALDGFKASQVLLKVQTTNLTKARDLVATKKAEAAANLADKRRYKQQALDAEQRVKATVQARRDALALARRAKAHDARLLARSKRRAAHVHQLLMAQIAREQRRGGGYTGATHGLLMRPVNGPITSPYGYRENPVMHYWGLHDGDDFGAACGTPIWSAGNGRVISEYYSSVWGHRIYVNLGLVNGKNVTVIYNHLSAYRTHVGQTVTRGQVIGLIGTTGWSTGCHTHMTVMVNGVAVNPAPWLGL
ncbi:MAG: peptidoglycan DD-metalloendopeptidase family protein [Nocardioides sp.]